MNKKEVLAINTDTAIPKCNLKERIKDSNSNEYLCSIENCDFRKEIENMGFCDYENYLWP